MNSSVHPPVRPDRSAGSPARLTLSKVSDPDTLDACRRLRYRSFFGGDGVDADPFDELCQHVAIRQDSRLVATFRYTVLDHSDAYARCYSAQSYGLGRVAGQGGVGVELGRFCIAEDTQDPDVLRLALAALTDIVDRAGAWILFGCSSFQGTDPARYQGVFSALSSSFIAPERFAPDRISPDAIGLGAGGRASLNAAPPLLRSYLGLGGWVSDHAVVDRAMNTIHVFTGVETARVPPRRAEALRRLAHTVRWDG